MFIGTVKLSAETISRWIMVTLGFAGIDGNVFKPHSTGACSHCWKTYLRGYIVSGILNVAGWSNEKTFVRFHNKDPFKC